MIVFGSGGHTTEMLLMLDKFSVDSYKVVHFVIAHSDTWSATKIQDYFRTKFGIEDVENHGKIRIHRLYRAREVKQSYMTSILTTLWGLVHSFALIARTMPDLIVTNGPGTAVPLCYANFILQKVMLWKPSAQIIFIESFCRVTSLSLTGKLLRPIADQFVVHWQELAAKYPSVKQHRLL